MSILRQTCGLWLAVILMPACASSGLQVQSSPEGAEVKTLSGELLGKTPFTLSAEQMQKHAQANLLDFKVLSAGRIPRVMTVDVATTRVLNVALPEATAESFKSEFALDFSEQLNLMLRRAFSVQKLVADGKRSEAETEIQKFNTDYPFAAVGHVMSAQLALMNRKESEARTHLQRAKILDPSDPNIDQSLRILRPEGR